MRIDKLGIYRGIVPSDYHADPCPEPSLTQSIAKILLERSPRHAWTAHPRLNHDWEEDNDKKFDLGNVAHALVLGCGKDFEILPFDDYRTKAAQQARDAAHEAGTIAILQHQFEQASEMVQAARHQIQSHEDADVLNDTTGQAEVMLAWQEDGIWFRALVDWLHDDLRTVDDYKTTLMSVAPHVIGIRAEAAGWHIQAAFIERGLNILDPKNIGKRKFRFIAQETDKPHALTVMHMDEHWLTMGHKQVDIAAAIWRRCIKCDSWPGYPAKGIVPEFPGYKEKQWLDREMSGEFDPTVQMAG
jgi:hypothetical protein